MAWWQEVIVTVIPLDRGRHTVKFTVAYEGRSLHLLISKSGEALGANLTNMSEDRSLKAWKGEGPLSI